MADPHFVVAVLDTSGNLVNAGDSANSLIRVSIVGGGGGGVTGSISAGTTKGTLGEVVFSNSPTVTFGMDGQTVTASAVGGAGGGVALSAGTQSVNTGTVVFANSNGMTFGMSGSSQVTASYTVPSTAGLLSAVNVSAGTTSNNLSALTFDNAGGVSFGLNGSVVTAAAPAGGGGLTNINVSAGTTSNNLSAFQFNNGNGVSFGLDGSTVTASHNGLTSQSNQAFSAGGGSSAFQTLVFNDANGVTWSNNAGSVQASYSQSTHSHSTAPGGIAAGTQTATSGTVVFANSNNFTFGMSNSSQITASFSESTHSHATAAYSAANGSFTANTVSFSNANGVSFVTSAGSAIAASVNTSYRASNDAVGLNTAQSNVTWTVNSAGLSLDARGYAGTGTSATNASITLNSNGLAISVAAPGGGAAVNVSAGTTSNNLQTIQFDNSNGVSFGLNGSTITGTVATNYAASDHSHGNPQLNLTNLSGTTASNSAGFTLSLSAAAAGGGVTLGGWEPIAAGNNSTFSSLGQNSLYMQKLVPGQNYSGNNFELRMSGSFVSSSNSQVAAHTIRYGLYSLNTANGSYSSIGSSSMFINASYNSNTAMGYTISQGAASFTTSSGGTAIASLLTGFKHLYLPFTTTLTAGGSYAFALHISSATTVGTSPHRMAIWNQSIINNLTVGKVYATTLLASNSTFVGDYNQGVYSATTGAMPAAVAQSEMTNAISQMRLYVQLEV